MDLGIKDRVALVTGAGRGIGRQICLTLGQEGARVAVNDLFQDRADAVAEDIRHAGGQSWGVAADVTDGEAVESMVRRIAEAWGPVDILVNNAGLPVIETPRDPASVTGEPFSRSDRAGWDRVMGLITYGVLNCSRAVVEGMSQRRWGRIVNIISDAGRVGEQRLAAYSMAKAGVVGFTKALAREMGRHCVTVNCVSPATTLTEATEDWLQAQGEQIMGQYPLGRGLKRLGLPTDIADAVAFMASQRAEWITGQVLSVNGGFTMPD